MSDQVQRVRAGERTFEVPASMSHEDILAAVGSTDTEFANGQIRVDDETSELVVERIAGTKG